MATIADGDWHECDRCGHVVFLNDAAFKCMCEKCIRFNP